MNKYDKCQTIFNMQRLLIVELEGGGFSSRAAKELAVHPVIFGMLDDIRYAAVTPSVIPPKVTDLAAYLISCRDYMKDFIVPEDERRILVDNLANMARYHAL